MPENTDLLTLAEVRHRFDQWRSTKSLHDKIPEALWEAAASLVPPYTCSQVVKELRLDFTAFKHRVQRRTREQMSLVRSDFVEIPSSVISSFVRRSVSSCDCLEIERADGAKMRLQARAGQNFDVATLIDTFLGGHHGSAHRAQ